MHPFAELFAIPALTESTSSEKGAAERPTTLSYVPSDIMLHAIYPWHRSPSDNSHRLVELLEALFSRRSYEDLIEQAVNRDKRPELFALKRSLSR